MLLQGIYYAFFDALDYTSIVIFYHASLVGTLSLRKGIKQSFLPQGKPKVLLFLLVFVKCHLEFMDTSLSSLTWKEYVFEHLPPVKSTHTHIHTHGVN